MFEKLKRKFKRKKQKEWMVPFIKNIANGDEEEEQKILNKKHLNLLSDVEYSDETKQFETEKLQNDMKRKVITHHGHFHGDEMLAIALLNKVFDVEVERREPTDEDLEDDTVFVIDIGKRHEQDKLNFDHHHFTYSDGERKKASNILVLDYLYEKGYFPPTYDDQQYAYATQRNLKYFMFQSVAEEDHGKVFKHEDGYNIPGINTIVRNMATVYEFDEVFEVVDKILDGFIHNALEAAKGEEKFKNLEEPIEGIKIQRDTNIIPNWKYLAAKEGIDYIITPGRDEGTWNIISRDSDEIEVPEESSKQVFRHQSGFMAVYNSIDDILSEFKENEAII